MDIRMELSRYLDYCLYRKELDAKTVKAYQIDLRQFADAAQDNPTDRGVIEDYITSLHRHYRQKTVKRKTASLRAFYSYLEDAEILTDNPFRRIRTAFREDAVLPRIVARKDIEAILNEIYGRLQESTPAGRKRLLRDIAVLEVLFGTGARVSEVSMITPDSIDLDTGTIRFDGKGGRERCVQIGEEKVVSVLWDYYEQNTQAIRDCGYFFVNRSGRRFREQSIRDMLKKHAKAAGVERRVTPHQFRHAVATYLIEEGVDISYVRQILGHSSLRTTQIYLHVATEKQAEVLRLKHPRRKMNINDRKNF